MWQKPEILKTYLARSAAHRLLQKVCVNPNITLPVPDDCATGGKFLTSMMTEMSDDKYQESAELFIDRLFEKISLIAKQIEVTRQFSLLDEFYTILAEIRVDGDDDIYSLLYIIIVQIHYLIGDETKVLVGYSGRKPLFKNLRKQVTSVEDLRTMILPVKGQLLWYDNETDLDYISDPTDIYQIEQIVDQIPIFNDLRIITNLYQDLKENFRYAPDPDGTEVVIHGYPILKWVKIKPKQMYGTGDFGLMIKAEFTYGSLTMVAVDPDVLTSIGMDHGGRPYNFAYFIAWLIYHDLCTAKEVKVNDRSQARQDWKPAKTYGVRLISEYKPRFIYIQRTISTKVLKTDELKPIRKECTNNFKSPHAVRGHVRKTKMSDIQRTKVEDYDRQSGLDIIKHLSKNSTYVLPYDTGKDTAEHWQPIFVKANLQQDIIRLLKSGD